MPRLFEIAASAASVVAMSGDETLIAPTAMMIYDPSKMAFGNKEDMKKAISLLDEVKESIINAYEDKTHLSRDKIAKIMSDETWLNAKKAYEMGFADGILFADKKKPVSKEEKEPEETEKEDSLTAMTYSKLKNMSAFLSKISASEKHIKGTPINQLDKRLALLKY